MPAHEPESADSILIRFAEAFGGAIKDGVIAGAAVLGQPVEVWATLPGTFRLITGPGLTYTASDLKRYARMTLGLIDAPSAANDNEPVDLWAERERPSLPYRVLPKAIEEFARGRASQMGVDPGGIAIAALTVCAAAISDRIKLQVKAHDAGWTESARLWACLVGSPSSKKSPILRAATAPLVGIDQKLVDTYCQAKASYDRLDKAGKAAASPPRQVRTVLNDVTVEAAQDVLRDNPQGLLMLRDELSGWFGSMEKYSSGKGSAADRAFWLESFNGGPSTTNRVGRGVVNVPNLSINLLGGIQPEPIRALARDAHDDGLLQRILPVVLGPASIGHDEPAHDSAIEYDALVRRLYAMQPPRAMAGHVPMDDIPLRFSTDAQDLRSEMEAKHHAMVTTWESVNKKLSAHLGKYDSFFARLCIVFHCIDCDGRTPACEITLDTAEMAAAFLHQYLFPHALAFYTNVLGLSDQHDRVLATAGFILAHDLSDISPRDVMRGDRTMRNGASEDAAVVLERLDAFGWLEPKEARGNQRVTHYKVRPAVHDKFAEQAEAEDMKRERIRAAIREATT